MPIRETWKAVPGWSGYQVSDKGRVKRLSCVSSNGNKLPDRVLTVSFLKKRSGNHYATVFLYKPKARRHGKRYWYVKSVGFLVLIAFVGPRPRGFQVCHWDDDQRNNNLDNLRWGTSFDNATDSIRNGRRPRGVKHHLAKLTEEMVLHIRREYQPNSRTKGMSALGRLFGVSHTTVRDVVSGKSWAVL